MRLTLSLHRINLSEVTEPTPEHTPAPSSNPEQSSTRMSPRRRREFSAGRLCAKHAILAGLSLPTSLSSDISIDATPGGWPAATLTGAVRDHADAVGARVTSISITHTSHQACAVALLAWSEHTSDAAQQQATDTPR